MRNFKKGEPATKEQLQKALEKIDKIANSKGIIVDKFNQIREITRKVLANE